jgi:hypothetical protein
MTQKVIVGKTNCKAKCGCKQKKKTRDLENKVLSEEDLAYLSLQKKWKNSMDMRRNSSPNKK